VEAKSGVQIAVSIKKDALKRENWEAGMRLLGREADWGRLPHSVIIHASAGRLSDTLARLADHDPSGHQHGASHQDIA